MEGVRYKEGFNVPFTPFMIFSRFVRNRQKSETILAFFLLTPANQFTKTEKVVRQKVPVHVHKTDVPAELASQQSFGIEKKKKVFPFKKVQKF